MRIHSFEFNPTKRHSANGFDVIIEDQACTIRTYCTFSSYTLPTDYLPSPGKGCALTCRMLLRSYAMLWGVVSADGWCTICTVCWFYTSSCWFLSHNLFASILVLL